MKTYAVLTGDIINFTKLSNADRKSLINETDKLLKLWVKEPDDAEIFRGDSYQVLFDDIEKALMKSIQLICWFKKHSDKKKQHAIGTRISIGIGTIAYKGKTVLDSDGEAFHQSGRNFDKMENDELLSIKTADENKNRLIRIILMFVNLIIGEWTKNQAEAIYLLLEDNGITQQKIAESLQVQQSGINKRLKIARWKEIEKAIKYLSGELIK